MLSFKHRSTDAKNLSQQQTSKLQENTLSDQKLNQRNKIDAIMEKAEKKIVVKVAIDVALLGCRKSRIISLISFRINIFLIFSRLADFDILFIRNWL